MESWKESENWFAEWWPIFWGTYNWKHIGMDGSAQKGPRSKALEIAKRKVRSREKAQEILTSLREQIRFREHMVKLGNKQARFPMVTVWLNQERWSTEIDSYSETREAALKPAKQCSTPGCNKPVIGPRYPSCAFHETYTEEVQREERDWLARHGLSNATTQELIAFCKELKPKLAKGMP